ncbi:MAG: glutamate mutase L [Candidatus Binatia bacterium]
MLRPKHPNSFVDSSYLLYAVGLLSQSHPAVALQMFKRYMTPVTF